MLLHQLLSWGGILEIIILRGNFCQVLLCLICERFFVCHHQKGEICWDSMNPFEYLLSVLVITNNQPRTNLLYSCPSRKQGKEKFEDNWDEVREEQSSRTTEWWPRTTGTQTSYAKSLTSWANGLGLRGVRPKEYICRYDLIGSWEIRTLWGYVLLWMK